MRKSSVCPIVLALSMVVGAGLAPSCSAQDLSDLAQVRPGRTKAVTSSDPNFASNSDRVRYIKPGETLVLADIKGPATINHIWLTFNEARPNWL
ncbi:MAG: hypothetical protein ACM3VT_08980, partial [Solirubrobacterales bacterium]